MLKVFSVVKTRTDFFIDMCIDPSVFTTIRWDDYEFETIAGCDAGFFESLEAETRNRIEEMLTDFYEASASVF